MFDDYERQVNEFVKLFEDVEHVEIVKSKVIPFALDVQLTLTGGRRVRIEGHAACGKWEPELIVVE